MTETPRVGVVGSGTGQPRFGQPSSTRNEPVEPATRPGPERRELAEWLASPEARRLEGRWVLLSDDYEVKDSAATPSELFERHPEERAPFIVFVRPSNITYVV